MKKAIFRKPSAFILSGILCFFLSACSGNYQKAITAYNDGDYKRAAILFSEAAKQGLAVAQIKLGDCYYEGKGVPKDDKEALNWHWKAAEQGSVEAQFNLGYCYYKGKGVPKDYAEAVNWYRKAAEQGHAEAQFKLGLNDYEVQDYKEAVNWWRKAAEQGHAQAQSKLGGCYLAGEGVPKDYTQGFKLLLEASNEGCPEATNTIGWIYLNGWYGIKQNETEAIKWFLKAAEQGSLPAALVLMTQYNIIPPK